MATQTGVVTVDSDVAIERLIRDIINHKCQERMISNERYTHDDARDDYKRLHDMPDDKVRNMWYSRVGTWLNSCANEPWFRDTEPENIVDSQLKKIVDGEPVAYGYHDSYFSSEYEQIDAADVGEAFDY